MKKMKENGCEFNQMITLAVESVNKNERKISIYI